LTFGFTNLGGEGDKIKKGENRQGFSPFEFHANG
jgi:hypothetical protein